MLQFDCTTFTVTKSHLFLMSHVLSGWENMLFSKTFAEHFRKKVK